MRGKFAATAIVGVIGVISGCAVQPPTAPTVMALPAPGKSLKAFQQDDLGCQNYAQQQVALQSGGRVGSNPGAAGAVLGTVGGAALGAALGAVAGNAGAGTAIGATTGLLGGTSIGSGQAAEGQFSLQQLYNISYTQCMYSRGDTVRSPPPGYVYSAYPYPYGYPYSYPPLAWAEPPFAFGTGIFFFGHGGHGFHQFHRFDHFHHFGRLGGFHHH
jgi:hypothetical protein